jgi:large subunit ribosomal protein L4
MMTKKARKVAMNGIITMKAKDSAICGLALDKMEPKTKEAASIIERIGLSNQKVLLVLDAKNEGIEKSFRNIAKVKYILVDYLNPRDVLNADKVVFLEKALTKLNQA